MFTGKTYPDFLGCFIGLVMTGILAFGVKKSVRFNNILNMINFAVWIFIVIAGLFYADGTNWRNYGFAPFGANGVRSNFFPFVSIKQSFSLKIVAVIYVLINICCLKFPLIIRKNWTNFCISEVRSFRKWQFFVIETILPLPHITWHVLVC